jgi:NAD(P)-dependent dehydrogenase (short-subunit alcohol dehydrogenase family)
MGLMRLLHSKWFPPSIPESVSFANQTILITGATGGLGFETAVHFVNLGASRVIITGRSLSRGLEAKAKIESRTGIKDVVEVRELDMSRFADVKAFADKLTSEVHEIDYVLLNAGCFGITYQESPEGWEQVLQVNTLSTVLLALLLLPWMKRSAIKSGRTPHLGAVSSGFHTNIALDDSFPKEDILEYFNDRKNFSGEKTQYSVSKLLLMYALGEIVKSANKPLEGGKKPAVIVNSMCPGACMSDLGRQHVEGSAVKQYGLHLIMWLVMKSTEAGSRTLLLAALTTPEEQGKFIRHYGTEEEYKEQVSQSW